jgi:hypothetical protein
MEFLLSSFKNYGQPWDLDFHVLILKGIKEGAFHDGITKGPISLIPKGGVGKEGS